MGNRSSLSRGILTAERRQVSSRDHLDLTITTEVDRDVSAQRSAPTAGSSGYFSCLSMEYPAGRYLASPIVSSWPPNLSELTCPVATLSFVNALWLAATRRMMSNGAMTCRYIGQPFSEIVAGYE